MKLQFIAMSSNRSAVLNQALGLFYSKPGEITADKLNDAAITVQQLRDIVVREVSEIEAKLTADCRVELAASVGLFREGIVSLFQWISTTGRAAIDLGPGVVVKMAEEEDDDYDYIELYSDRSKEVKSSFPSDDDGANGATNEMTDFDQLCLKFCHDSQEKFKDARNEYLELLSHGNLDTHDKILLIKTQIAAALLENLNNPSDGLEMCRIRLEELHSLPVVRQVFSDELSENSSTVNAVSNEEQIKIFTSVCQINHAIFTVTLAFSSGPSDLLSLCVRTKDDRVHPLLDGRLVRKLYARGLGELDVTCSFGQKGTRPEHKLIEPWDVTVDSEGRYMVADWGGDGVKVFDSRGSFLYCLCVTDPDKELTFSPCSVATDEDDNVYVLAVQEDDAGEQTQGVYVFDKHAKLHHTFQLPQRDEFEGWSLTLVRGSENLVIVLGECAGSYRFDVYKPDGEFVNSFNDAIVGNANHIASTHDGKVMVADSKYDRVCILEFDSWGVHLKNFKVRGFPKGGIAFNPTTGHVIITSSPHNESVNNALVEVYTTDGDFVHAIALDANAAGELGGVAITPQGRIVIVNEEEHKINVL